MPSTSTKFAPSDAQRVAHNLRRLMVRFDLTYQEVVEASGLDERTIRSMALGRTRPHARSVHKLAEGLGVESDELFRDCPSLDVAAFDRATNPMVDVVRREHPELFEGWREQDFAELYSRMGQGGELTREGALAAAARMNDKRRVLDQARVLLETSEAPLLAEMVRVMYERAVKRGEEE